MEKLDISFEEQVIAATKVIRNFNFVDGLRITLGDCRLSKTTQSTGIVNRVGGFENQILNVPLRKSLTLKTKCHSHPVFYRTTINNDGLCLI